MTRGLRFAGMALIPLATITVGPSYASDPEPVNDDLLSGAHLRVARPTDDRSPERGLEQQIGTLSRQEPGHRDGIEPLSDR